MIIVIDGPAGSGKSSTARAVAEKLGIEYIDSGALYRAVTLLYVRSSDENAFFATLEQVQFSFNYLNGRFEVLIDGKDVTSQLRNAEVSQKVSAVAATPRIRSFVNGLMKRTMKQGTYIAEGRDLGTAVFPDAVVKFYMKADINERIRRRHLELSRTMPDITLEKVRENILKRDRKDSGRANDPLKKAPDAIEMDTSGLSFDEQVQQICSIIKTKTNL